MILVGILAVPLCALVAVATCRAVARFVPAMDDGRYVSLDGLRGFMALFVFLNHANVWYHYSHTGIWDVPAYAYSLNLGGSAVAMFFMITGFLFSDKLIRSGGKLRWNALYVSRVMRIYPVYIVAGLLTVLVTALMTGGDNLLRVAFAEHVKNAVEWLTFSYSSILGRHCCLAYVAGQDWVVPGVDSSNMLAYVTWSLPYEMFFYGALPVVALLLGARPRWIWLLVGALGCVALYKIDSSLSHQVYFLPGLIAALTLRRPAFGRWARTPLADGIALAALLSVVLFSRSTWGLSPTLPLLTIAFLIIANGASLFGLLSSRPARVLGEISYSVYLLHGLVLFCIFHFVVGLDVARTLSPAAHWLIMAAIAPVVILVSLATFRGVEHPMMRLGKTLAGRRPGGGEQPPIAPVPASELPLR